MQVTLKQSEIETAIKGFIAQQGINLCGKSVEVSFTAGRKESGISAEIDIEDINLPAVHAATQTALARAATVPVTPVIAPAIAQAIVEEEAKEPEEVPEPVKTSSLFG